MAEYAHPLKERDHLETWSVMGWYARRKVFHGKRLRDRWEFGLLVTVTSSAEVAFYPTLYRSRRQEGCDFLTAVVFKNRPKVLRKRVCDRCVFVRAAGRIVTYKKEEVQLVPYRT